MDTPYCFFRLLVKGSYLNDNEKNTVRTIYDSFGMNCIYEIVKEKKIIPFAANTFCNCTINKPRKTELTTARTYCRKN